MELVLLTEELVKAQTMAGAEYLKRANAIGLGQAWVDKIQSGEFKIDDLHSVDDADLIKDIQEYIKWYDQYLDMQEQADARQAATQPKSDTASKTQKQSADQGEYVDFEEIK